MYAVSWSAISGIRSRSDRNTVYRRHHRKMVLQQVGRTTVLMQQQIRTVEQTAARRMPEQLQIIRQL